MEENTYLSPLQATAKVVYMTLCLDISSLSTPAIRNLLERITHLKDTIQTILDHREEGSTHQ